MAEHMNKKDDAQKIYDKDGNEIGSLEPEEPPTFFEWRFPHVEDVKPENEMKDTTHWEKPPLLVA